MDVLQCSTLGPMFSNKNRWIPLTQGNEANPLGISNRNLTTDKEDVHIRPVVQAGI